MLLPVQFPQAFRPVAIDLAKFGSWQALCLAHSGKDLAQASKSDVVVTCMLIGGWWLSNLEQAPFANTCLGWASHQCSRPASRSHVPARFPDTPLRHLRRHAARCEGKLHSNNRNFRYPSKAFPGQTGELDLRDGDSSGPEKHSCPVWRLIPLGFVFELLRHTPALPSMSEALPATHRLQNWIQYDTELEGKGNEMEWARIYRGNGCLLANKPRMIQGLIHHYSNCH